MTYEFNTDLEKEKEENEKINYNNNNWLIVLIFIIIFITTLFIFFIFYRKARIKNKSLEYRAKNSSFLSDINEDIINDSLEKKNDKDYEYYFI